MTVGGASVGRACCSPTGPGGHRGAEGAGKQDPVEVARQQKALVSKPLWTRRVLWQHRAIASDGDERWQHKSRASKQLIQFEAQMGIYFWS
jgi:hypothetical protein